MRVLLADKLPNAAHTRLQASGYEVIARPELKDAALLDALAELQPAALVVRSTKVTAAHLDACPALQLVVRAGAGVNTIDVAHASALGVYVANCPGMNAVAVAELTFAHILNADRRVADCVADLRAGQWKKKTYAQAEGLSGRTLGVIGAGNIAQAVIARGHAFEMPVVAWAPELDEALATRLGVTRAASILDVAQRAYALTVHVALNAATRGLIGEAVFQALRPGAIFVNTSRGPVVDETALAKAVETRGLRAGLDVFCDEPAGDGPWSHPLAQLPGVYGTHHIGASTAQAQDAVAFEACRIIETWARTGSPPNVVNLATRTSATHLLVVRHADRVGVLASVLDQLREARINVQQMENVVFAGEAAACARIQLGGAPDADELQSIAACADVFDAQLVTL
jgi:D-3-phosphoglycerate dehydrogenase / 2-oxoglutarate reductase